MKMGTLVCAVEEEDVGPVYGHSSTTTLSVSGLGGGGLCDYTALLAPTKCERRVMPVFRRFTATGLSWLCQCFGRITLLCPK